MILGLSAKSFRNSALLCVEMHLALSVYLTIDFHHFLPNVAP